MSVSERIQSEVDTNDVILFMKGTPAMPQCGFSATVVQVLNKVGVAFKGVDVLADAELRDGIKTYSNWPTIPQLYIKGEFIGGADITREMYQSGELMEMLQSKGIATNAAA